MNIEIDRIGTALRMPGLVAAWLFGSARDGEVRPGGDVDIGVFFEKTPTLDALVECRARLQKALAVNDIDLVPLNGASPLLRFEALCGVRVLCADEQRCAAFASLTAREYEDEMAMVERAFRRPAEPRVGTDAST